jgi:hypothetical protein
MPEGKPRHGRREPVPVTSELLDHQHPPVLARLPWERWRLAGLKTLADGPRIAPYMPAGRRRSQGRYDLPVLVDDVLDDSRFPYSAIPFSCRIFQPLQA